jgi:hypothetical protein
MPAWPFVFYSLTGKIGTLGERPLQGAELRRLSRVASKQKQTSRGRKQDPTRVAGGQDYEVRYEAKKSGKSKAAVQKAVKKVGNTRKRVERTLGGRT